MACNSENVIDVAVQNYLYAIRKALCNYTAKIQLMAKTARKVTHAKLSPAVVVISWTRVQMLVAGP
jgi:hypothetical protein